MSGDTIRILAFGDSLTEGYCMNERGGLMFHPYTKELERLLEAQFPSLRIEVVNRGVCGELATGMPHRLEQWLHDPAPYDLAIFLAGTNDIGRALQRDGDPTEVGTKTGNAIADAIEAMVGAVHAKGTDAICMTTPEHGCEFAANFKFDHSPVARAVLRERLLALAAKSDARKCVVFDLGAALPFQSPEKLFCDMLHFNPKGYDLMAEKLFEIAVPLLQKRLERTTATDDNNNE